MAKLTPEEQKRLDEYIARDMSVFSVRELEEFRDLLWKDLRVEDDLEYPYEGYIGRVKVISADQRQSLGEGQIIGREDPLNLGMDTVTILLDDGRIIYGCECWWTPIKTRDR